MVTAYAIERARALRKRMTPSEKIMWAKLRGRRLAGIRFRRQQPIGRYIADYYCAEAKVVVELDGDSHAGNEAYDARRDAWLKDEGLTVVRVWDKEIFENLGGVLEMIYVACENCARGATFVTN